MLFAGLGGPLGVSAVLSLENKHLHLTVHWADVSTALGLVLFPLSAASSHGKPTYCLENSIGQAGFFFPPTSCIYAKTSKQK